MSRSPRNLPLGAAVALAALAPFASVMAQSAACPATEESRARLRSPLAVALLIDRSRSMQDHLPLAQHGASLACDLMTPEDRLAVVSFGADARVRAPARGATSAHREHSHGVIGELRALGESHLRDGLLTAQAELDQHPETNRAIIVFTDGCSDHAALTAAPTLRSKGTRVFTIAVGEGSDVEALRELARRTGGRAFYAADASALPNIVYDVANELTGGFTIARHDNERTASGLRRDVEFSVQADADRLTVSLACTAPSLVDLELRTPDGTIVDRQAPGVFARSHVQLAYRLTTPAAGLWRATVVGRDDGSAATYDFAALTTCRTTTIAVEHAPTTRFPQPVPVRARITPNLARGTVTAIVHDPSGRALTDAAMRLHDDGRLAHGDAVAGDGIFSGLFYDYTTVGTYDFRIAAVSPLPGTDRSSRAEVSTSVTVGRVPARVRAPANLILGPGAKLLDDQSVAFDDLRRRSVLHVKALAPDSEEDVFLEALTVHAYADRPCDLGQLGEIAVFLDADNDGRCDDPETPLASTQFSATSNQVTLRTADGAPLHIVPAHGQASFLVTLGDTDRPHRRIEPWMSGATLWLALLFSSFLLGITLYARSAAQKPARALAAAALGAIVLLPFSCGRSSDPNAPPTVTLNIEISADDVQARGATTHRRAPTRGIIIGARTTVES